MASLNCLNDDCLMEIFQYFDKPMDHLCVSKVCKRWKFLIEDNCSKPKQDLLLSVNNAFYKETMAFRDFNQILKLYGTSVEEITLHLANLGETSNVYTVNFNEKHDYILSDPIFSKIIDLFVNRLFSVKTICLWLPDSDGQVITLVELYLSKIERLEKLDVRGYIDYSMKIPKSLRSLSFIHQLQFNTVNEFDLISFIEQTTQLEELRIECHWQDYDSITDELLEALSKWGTKLKILQLYSATQSNYANLGKLKSLLDLEELKLHGLRFPKKDLLAIASSCKNIKTLEIPYYFEEEKEAVSFVKSSLPKLEELEFF